MARFARIDSQICANCLILANRFRAPELNPFFCESCFGGRKIANHRFWGDSFESLLKTFRFRWLGGKFSNHLCQEYHKSWKVEDRGGCCRKLEFSWKPNPKVQKNADYPSLIKGQKQFEIESYTLRVLGVCPGLYQCKKGSSHSR